MLRNAVQGNLIGRYYYFTNARSDRLEAGPPANLKCELDRLHRLEVSSLQNLQQMLEAESDNVTPGMLSQFLAFVHKASTDNTLPEAARPSPPTTPPPKDGSKSHAQQQSRQSRDGKQNDSHTKPPAHTGASSTSPTSIAFSTQPTQVPKALQNAMARRGGGEGSCWINAALQAWWAPSKVRTLLTASNVAGHT